MLGNLHILRAFATLTIVYFHVLVISEVYGQAAFVPPFLMSWGELGVDCFFAMSGFVLVFSQEKAGRSAGEFLKSRLLRIIPIYWVMTLFMVALFFAFPQVFNGVELKLSQILASLLFVSGFSLDQKPLLYVGWTLEYEMLFYWILAAGFFLKNRQLSFWVPMLTLAILAFTGPSRVFFLDFILGMAAAKLFLDRVAVRYGAFCFSLAIVWLAFLMAVPTVDRPWTSLPAFLFVFGLVNMRQVNVRAINYIGDASYSIYLGQVFAVPAFYKVSSRLMTGVPVDLIAVVAFVASCLLGCFLYELIERPLGAYLKRAF